MINLTAYEQVLFKLGERHEKAHLATFSEYVDLSEGNLEAREQQARKGAEAWQELRNNKNAKVNWQFTTKEARIKLSRLYPTIDD